MWAPGEKAGEPRERHDGDGSRPGRAHQSAPGLIDDPPAGRWQRRGPAVALLAPSRHVRQGGLRVPRRNRRRPARARSTVALWAARILLGLLGASIVSASIYFTFWAAPEDGGVSAPVDWVVAAWALAMGLGLVAVAVRLGAPGTMRIAVGLVLAHIAFGLVKLVGYGETESVGIFAVDLLILAVLAAASRSRA